MTIHTQTLDKLAHLISPINNTIQYTIFQSPYIIATFVKNTERHNTGEGENTFPKWILHTQEDEDPVPTTTNLCYIMHK